MTVHTTVMAIVLVSIASFIGSLGALFLKAGAGRLHEGWIYLVLNPRLILGVVLFCGSSLFYILAVRQGELSILYPLVSLSYIWAVLWSRLFLGERLNRAKTLGLLLILCGIVFIGIGKN
jgi:uncharacterized membrane protein